MTERVCFIGHSHTPTIFLETAKNQVKVIEPNNPYYNLKGRRAIMDVGSVGLPRNRKNNAGFVIYDPDEDIVEYKRFIL